MKTVGVICEYNPFHNGHRTQLLRIREQCGNECGIVCLMSGCYVQRGEPAIFEPSVRARAAVLCGADLVLELPINYALRSAEGFADGGVSVLSALGVDALCFGAETGNAESLLSLAKHLLTTEFSTALKEALKSGDSFASARATALRRHGGAELLRLPNDILAVEYCKAILRRGAALKPFVIRREGDYHASAPAPKHPSASAIRSAILNGETWEASVPPKLLPLYRDAVIHSVKAGERAVLARVRTLPDETFEALPFGTEGLWRKLMHACRSEESVEAILEAAKSKRYARTRLQRMLLCAYLGITEDELYSDAPYVRVLAFNDRGRQLLRRFRARDTLPIIDSGADTGFPYQALERRAYDLYSLFRNTTPCPCGLSQAARNQIVNAEETGE